MSSGTSANRSVVFSRFNVCDGGPQSAGFLVEHDCPPPLEGMAVAFSQPRAASDAVGVPSSKHAKVASQANAGTQTATSSPAQLPEEGKSALLSPAKESRSMNVGSVLAESVH